VKVLLFAAAAIALACASVAGARPASPPTLKPGVLTVGLDPPAVGFQVGTLRGQKVINPHGFEIDLAKAIQRKLGLAKIQYIKVPFNVLFRPGAKPFDLAFEERPRDPLADRERDDREAAEEVVQPQLLEGADPEVGQREI
jgi:ABC-type amino acid transport substrate-binding protein